MVKNDFEILLRKIDRKMKRNARIVAERKKRKSRQKEFVSVKTIKD